MVFGEQNLLDYYACVVFAYIVEAHPSSRDPAGDGGGDNDVAPAGLQVRQREVGGVDRAPEVEILHQPQTKHSDYFRKVVDQKARNYVAKMIVQLDKKCVMNSKAKPIVLKAPQ
jgi:hypothetical protein